MKPRVLILGDTLAGLVTAWRLGLAGFQVTLLQTSDPSQETPATLAMPFVCSGPHTHTDSLMQELKLPRRSSPWLPLGMEFPTTGDQLFRFPNPPLPAPWNMLWGITNFSAFPVRQRWQLLNYLEKVWEKKAALPNSLDLQTTDSWLTTLGQPQSVQQSIWNPLCRFLLGSSLSHTRAGNFVNIATRVFFQSRHHFPRIPESPEFMSTLAQTLQTQLNQQGATTHQGPSIEHLQVSSERITGVCLSNGTILTADWYVSALPPKALTSLLSERLLARYSMFHQMHQQTFTSMMAFNVWADSNIKTPQLLLHPGPFAWTLCRAAPKTGEPGTLISCISSGDQDLFSQTDEHLTNMALEHLEHLSSHIPHLNIATFREQALIRQPLGFAPYIAGSGPTRPSNHTPISNLFLAGSWTDTNAANELESAITSGDLCAQALTTLSPAHN